MVILYGVSGTGSLIPLWGPLIGIGVEFFVADIIIVLLGKNKKLRKFLSMRGYYFDYDFQDQWNDKIAKM